MHWFYVDTQSSGCFTHFVTVVAYQFSASHPTVSAHLLGEFPIATVGIPTGDVFCVFTDDIFPGFPANDQDV